MADLYDAAPRPLADRLGVRTEVASGATALIAAGLPTAIFNRVVGLGLQDRATTSDVEYWMACYRSAGVANWWLSWSPAAEPPDFADSLLARGFFLPTRRSWAKMLRDAAPPPQASSGMQIAEADPPQIEAVARCITDAFEMPAFMATWFGALYGRPRWRMYVALDQGEVVGGACLFIDRDTAWLGMGGVIVSHRRRGGQLALMSRRIADAVAAGCRWIVTETGEPIGDEPNPSLANMRRCGFRLVASRLNFQAPAVA